MQTQVFKEKEVFDEKIERLKLQAQAAQFVFGLDPQTLLPIDLVAPVINKTAATVRTDATRRPGSLPQITRKNGRVFVKVAHLLEYCNTPDRADEYNLEPKRRVGRPTKAEQIEWEARKSRMAAAKAIAVATVGAAQ